MIMSVGGVKGESSAGVFILSPCEAARPMIPRDKKRKPATLNNYSGGVDEGLTNGSNLEFCCAESQSVYKQGTENG